MKYKDYDIVMKHHTMNVRVREGAEPKTVDGYLFKFDGVFYFINKAHEWWHLSEFTTGLSIGLMSSTREHMLEQIEATDLSTLVKDALEGMANRNQLVIMNTLSMEEYARWKN